MTNRHPRQRTGLSVRTVGDEAIVLDRGANQIHQLNASAAFVWARCDGAHAVDRIAEELAGAFDVDARTANEAVASAVQQFERLGLLAADGG
jgi:hypothetical protein